MDATELLKTLRRSKSYRGQICHVEKIPSRPAVYGELTEPLRGAAGQALRGSGVERLYIHQVEAIEAARRGESFVVVTSTASGKTICYNAPVLEAISEDPSARALYLYPTKALAQDQLGKLKMYGVPDLGIATYDGDTPRKERTYIKAMSSIVLTNPDMLHVGILPYHSTWSTLFRHLRYVVLDEVHSYRGVFGAHVAQIIRRLRRIAHYYGSDPIFICASATVGNPAELVRQLTGLDVRVISTDGAPSGEKTFVFWNPPYIETAGYRRSSNSESVELLARLVDSDIRTIVFTKARKTAELILRYTRAALKERKSDKGERIMAYRAGYRPQERRQIEKRLFSGELLGVTSTSALEVGVDVGGLDAVVMTGYPGTVAGVWQQAGRAGRGSGQSLAVLVALDNPMDQYIMRNPAYFFGARHEQAVVDTSNAYILADHLTCAAYELPITNDEVEGLFGESAYEVLDVLCDLRQIEYRGRWLWGGGRYPAGEVSIRSAASGSFVIIDVAKGGRMLGTVDSVSVYETCHPGAVYLHAGESYVVEKLDITEQAAYVSATEVNYYTLPGTANSAIVEQEISSSTVGETVVRYGDVVVSSRVTHFWRKELYTDNVLDRVALDLPETSLHTTAVWIEVPDSIARELARREFDLTGTIHAVEHVAISVFGLLAVCDRNDIGGVSHPGHPDTSGRPAIFIYDGYPGGVGLAHSAFGKIGDLLSAALNAVRDCGCDFGCPSCIQSPKCGNNNQPLDKGGAIFLLELMTPPFPPLQGEGCQISTPPDRGGQS